MDDAAAAHAYAGSEFALLEETANEIGLPWSAPTVSRIATADVGGLRWGTGPIDVVFLHGGGQNAHTWDAVILALLRAHPDLSALAIDLPGHGHSAWRPDRDYSPTTNAATLAPVVQQLAPDASTVVGMSLGGLTALALEEHFSGFRRRIMVDVTPASHERLAQLSRVQRGSTALVAGPRSYATFTEILDATVAASPSRSRTSLRRGVLHNARLGSDGQWTWRYDALDKPMDFSPLWSILGASTVPTLLVRGANSPFVTDEDEAEFLRRNSSAVVHKVAGASHSVQSDQPIELAELIDRFALTTDLP
ncbi:alpha/beta fold hydrolase [Antrihabitans sp. YC2-6]|uniref:alpha/beta fold hydrolase n=1 Tax=Antrihabitans sp. YC2-6 TaxID=2799498 RepID=UPI0018F4B9A1|nr:alpha/beta hydrolase [Antrihabitans sp. YC2-6]MBJ8348290.1 alpha/beta hydrolase [Antrihabitans sp. YC2-6]